MTNENLFNVYLDDVNQKKVMDTIKVVRNSNNMGLGLKQSRDAVVDAPSLVLENAEQGKAEEMVLRLKKFGNNCHTAKAAPQLGD